MGAINYFTSDYITLGVKPYETSDFSENQDFLDFIREELNIDTENENAVYNAALDEIQNCYECDIENIKTELNKHNFYYYHIAIKPGYYEGFTLDIENNFGVAYGDYIEKREAQKEITEIKAFLVACAGLGLVECSPGWCTGYADYNGTLEAIKEAIQEMRQEARTTPTWRDYNANRHYKNF